MKNYKFLLTRQGLLIEGEKRSGFYSNELKFRRFANHTEIAYLQTLNLAEGLIEIAKSPLLDDKLNVIFSDWQLEKTPKDWTKSNNAGDYATFIREVKVNGTLWGLLQDSSCDINECCEISGDITDCDLVNILGEDNNFSVVMSKFYTKNFIEWSDGQKFCSMEDLLNLLIQSSPFFTEEKTLRTRGGRR